MFKRNKKGYIKNLLVTSIFSIICGALTGLIIFLFKLVAHKVEYLSKCIYELSKESVLYIILVLLGLVFLAVVMYFAQRKIPEIKGGGIPKSEGVLRGVLTFKSLRTLVGTFFGSLISFFVGVPVGTEGPSVLIGTSIGDLCTKITKSKPLERYINTGGAAAGFAVATGAPFSGILFALEEIHKRFTPMLVITVSLSVLSATIVNLSLCNIFEINPNLFNFNIISFFKFYDLIYLIILAILIALSVGLFDKSIGFVFKNIAVLIKKIPSLVKLIILFLLTGILGYIFIDGIYSGHNIIEMMIDFNDKNSYIILLLILLIRLIMMHLVMDSGVTGGIFIPTMAIAAVMGAIFGKLLILIGMNKELYSLVVILTMCAFVGGSLRAPFTAVVLFIEIVGISSNLFYIILVIFIVNFIVEIFDQPSFYDRVLDRMEFTEHKDEVRKIGYFEIKISENSFVVGKAVRDIMWPFSLIVLNIKRCNENLDKLDNDGVRKLYANDTITFRCSYYNETDLIMEIQSLVGDKYDLKTKEIV